MNSFQFNELIVGYFSVLLASLAVLAFFYRQEMQGLFVSRWMRYAVVFSGIYAFISILMYGWWQLDFSRLLNAHSLLAQMILLFILQELFHFPGYAVFHPFVSLQRWMTFGFLVGILVGMINTTLALTGRLHVPLSLLVGGIVAAEMLCLAIVARLRLKHLIDHAHIDDELEELDVVSLERVQATLRRLMWFFGLPAIFTLVMIFSRQFSPSYSYLSQVSRAYILLIVFFGHMLIYMSTYKGRAELIERVVLIILLIIYLVIGFASLVQSLLLRQPESSLLLQSEVDTLIHQISLPVVGMQYVLTAAIALFLPGMLKKMLPDDPPVVREENPVEPLKFTGRQFEILGMLSDNLSNKDIARQMVVTEDTVKYHVSNLLRKTDFENRYELAGYARELIQQGKLQKQPG